MQWKRSSLLDEGRFKTLTQDASPEELERLSKVYAEVNKLWKLLPIKPYEHIPFVGSLIYYYRLQKALYKTTSVNIKTNASWSLGRAFLLGAFYFTLLTLMLSATVYQFIIARALNDTENALINRQLS